MKTEIYPRAEADIIRQFRYYLVDQDAPAVAFRFREAVIESVEQLKPHPRMGTLEAIRIYYLEVSGPSARGQNSPWQAQRAADFKAGKTS